MKPRLEVLPQVRRVLITARKLSNVSYGQVAVRADRVENAIRRFESGISGPAFKDIDMFVEAYAEATNFYPDELWGIAVQVATHARDEVAGVTSADINERYNVDDEDAARARSRRRVELQSSAFDDWNHSEEAVRQRAESAQTALDLPDELPDGSVDD